MTACTGRRRDGEPESPLGPLAADAAREGYEPPTPSEAGPQAVPRVPLQDPARAREHAPGGAKSYVTDGKMTDGFALVAWPAEYRVSGVMTFVVNQNGIVFEKDLGAKTALAPAIEKYDPDTGWKPTKS